MIRALHSNLPDLSTPPPTNEKTTVWIVAVSLLRFGKEKRQLQTIVDSLTGISGKLEVKIMSLDSFGIPMDKVIPILTDYIDEFDEISHEIGTNNDQGKNSMADSDFHDEQSFVSSNARKVKKRLKQGDVELKEMIERGLNLVTDVDSSESEKGEFSLLMGGGRKLSYFISITFSSPLSITEFFLNLEYVGVCSIAQILIYQCKVVSCLEQWIAQTFVSP